MNVSSESVRWGVPYPYLSILWTPSCCQLSRVGHLSKSKWPKWAVFRVSFSFCIVRAISQSAKRQKLPSAPYTNFGNARGTLNAFSEVPTSSDAKTMGNHQLIFWLRALYISSPSGTRHAIWGSNVNHCFMLLTVDTKQRENDLRLPRALDWVWGH